MLRSRAFLISAVLVCIVALTVVVFAQVPGRRGQGPMGPGARQGLWRAPCAARLFAPPAPQAVERISQELGLTEAQKTKALALTNSLRGKIQAVAGKGQPVPDLIAELKADPTDEKKVKRLVAEVTKRESAILQAELDTWMAFEKMLTPEQSTKFWDLLTRRPGRGAGAPPGMGGRRARPAPPVE